MSVCISLCQYQSVVVYLSVGKITKKIFVGKLSFWFGTNLVGKMSGWENFGWENVVWENVVGKMSGWENVEWENVWLRIFRFALGKCLVGKMSFEKLSC